MKQNNTIKTKLKDDSGATLFIALLFFIICATCGAVILVAGTQAAGRLSGLTENEQNLYAATSAAKLLKDEIDGRTATVVMDSDNNITSVTILEKKTLVGKGEGVNDLLTDVVKGSLQDNYNITVNGKTTEVTIEATNYNILATCTAGSGDNAVTAYAELPAGVQENTTTDDSGNTVTTKEITWSGGLVKGQSESEAQ